MEKTALLTKLWLLTREVKALKVAFRFFPENCVLAQEITAKEAVIKNALLAATLALPNRYCVAEVHITTCIGSELSTVMAHLPGKPVEVIGFLEDDMMVRFVTPQGVFNTLYSSIQ